MSFWRDTPLQEMTAEQWESLCDGCAQCCLSKTEDADTGEIRLVAVTCRFLDLRSCRCEVYADRFDQHPDCLALRAELVQQISWLPDTCAYRLVAAGEDLPAWHPLVSGDPQAVHLAGISVRDRAVSGKYVHPDDLGTRD